MEYVTKAKANISKYVFPLIAVYRCEFSFIIDHLLFLFYSSTKKMTDETPVVFILWDESQNETTVIKKFSNYLWAHPIHIPSTYIMEGYFYSNMLGNIIDLSGLTSTWLGTIRYDKVRSRDRSIVNKMISDKTLVDAGVALLSFYDPLATGESIQFQADAAHPGLMNLLDYVLESVGERKEDIRKLRTTTPNFKGIFSYSFVARPHLMHDFATWMSRALLFLITNVNAQEMVWKDSKYGGSDVAFRGIFGLPFCPLHPFFGERLISYYFNARGYKIMTINEYNTKTNDDDRVQANNVTSV